MFYRALLTLSLVMASTVTSAERQFDQSIGFRFETQWRFGETHVTQSRWLHSFAVAKTADLFRFIRPVHGVDVEFNKSQTDYELASVIYEYRSPFIFEYQFEALGDAKTSLFGIPVAKQVSPVNSATGKETSWVANPWVWVGALAVGAAAAGGGGGGSGSSIDGSGGTNVNVDPEFGTVVGGDECNVVGGSPSNPEIVSGCHVAE